MLESWKEPWSCLRTSSMLAAKLRFVHGLFMVNPVEPVHSTNSSSMLLHLIHIQRLPQPGHLNGIYIVNTSPCYAWHQTHSEIVCVRVVPYLRNRGTCCRILSWQAAQFMVKICCSSFPCQGKEKEDQEEKEARKGLGDLESRMAEELGSPVKLW